MSRLYMLDTNTVSCIVKGKSPAARARLAGLGMDETACISIVTEFELEFGLAKKPNAKSLRDSLRWFLARIKVLPLGSAEARAYGRLRVKQKAAGRPLESMDKLIAAHAIAVGAILITGDAVFSHVPDLLGRENWATDLVGTSFRKPDRLIRIQGYNDGNGGWHGSCAECGGGGFGSTQAEG